MKTTDDAKFDRFYAVFLRVVTAQAGKDTALADEPGLQLAFRAGWMARGVEGDGADLERLIEGLLPSQKVEGT